MSPTVLTETLLRIAAERGDRRAIGGADGRWWTWQEITRAIESIGSSLADAGIARGSRVAIVVPDGPLAAITIWAVACAATAVPIPDASEEEVVRWIGAIAPDAIVTVPGRVGVQSWATKHNVPLGLIRTDAEEATLDFDLPRDVTTSIAPEVAIVMLTSGSTGVPKQIPRSDTNVLQAVGNYATAIGLTPEDRAFTMMPLHHSHGLMAGVLAPLLSGGATVVASMREMDGTPVILAQSAPTWVTAGPTMHRHMLERMTGTATNPVRFVRCASDHLSQELRRDLVAVYRAPVITSFGVTECPFATAQHPDDPGPEDGLGRPIVEMAMLGDDGAPVERGEVGLIAVRGPSVSAGPRVGDGWYTPGDRGVFLPSGELRFLGRVREAIRRGSEEIAPDQVEAVLRGHPAIEDAAVFPIGHAVLGEDVAAAVVIRPGQDVSAREVRRWVLASLPTSCVPRQIWVMDRLPMTETGKIARAQVRAAAERDGVPMR